MSVKVGQHAQKCKLRSRADKRIWVFGLCQSKALCIVFTHSIYVFEDCFRGEKESCLIAKAERQYSYMTSLEDMPLRVGIKRILSLFKEDVSGSFHVNR